MIRWSAVNTKPIRRPHPSLSRIQTVSQLSFRREAEKSCFCMWLKMQDLSLRSRRQLCDFMDRDTVSAGEGNIRRRFEPNPSTELRTSSAVERLERFELLIVSRVQISLLEITEEEMRYLSPAAKSLSLMNRHPARFAAVQSSDPPLTPLMLPTMTYSSAGM